MQAVNRTETVNLYPGERYLWRARELCGLPAACEPVWLAGFHPCPALVVVLDRFDRRLIVQRVDLYAEG